MELYDARTSYQECIRRTEWGYGKLTLDQHRDAIVKFTRPVRKDSTNTGVEAVFRSMFTDYGDNRVALCCDPPEWEAKTIEINFSEGGDTTEKAWQACEVQADKITINFANHHLLTKDASACSTTLECQNYICHVLYVAFATYKHENECAINIESTKLQTNWQTFVTKMCSSADCADYKIPETSTRNAPIKLLHIQAAVACIQVAQIPYGTEIPEPCEPLCVCYQVDCIFPGFSARFCFREFYRLLGNSEADGDVEAYSVCDMVWRIVNMRLQLGEVKTLDSSVTLSRLSQVLNATKTENGLDHCHIPFAIHVDSDSLPPYSLHKNASGCLHVFSGHYTYE